MAGSSASVMTPVVVLLAILSSLSPLPAAANLLRLEHSPKSDGPVTMLVLGDWGRRGAFNQSLVAVQMGRIGEQLGIDFVISTGDNFYEKGLAGVDDTNFEDSFFNIYTTKSLQKPWYTVLGNHDYMGDVLAQLSPALRNIDGRFICMRSFILNADIVDFFFIDTSPFVLQYWTNPGENKYDWRGVAPREAYISNLLEDLDSALKQSKAAWKIVVGHHPMRSVSSHGDTQELLQLVLPVLNANGVNLYINGHDHCLEHISSRDSPLQYLTSGGGSKAWGGTIVPNADKLEFFYDGQGFMSLHLTRTEARVVFYDVSGSELYHWGLTRTASEFHPGHY